MGCSILIDNLYITFDISSTKTGIAIGCDKWIILTFLTSKTKLHYRERIEVQADVLESFLKNLKGYKNLKIAIEEYSYGSVKKQRSKGTYQIGEATGVLVNRIKKITDMWVDIVNVSSWKKHAGLSKVKKADIRRQFCADHKDLDVVQDQVDAYYILKYYVHRCNGIVGTSIRNFGRMSTIDDAIAMNDLIDEIE